MEDYELAYAIIRGETFEEIVFSSEEEAETYCDERRNGASGDALDEMGCEDPEPEDEMEASFYAGMQGDYWHVETVHLTGKDDDDPVRISRDTWPAGTIREMLRETDE